jgi:hypothetical protein
MWKAARTFGAAALSVTAIVISLLTYVERAHPHRSAAQAGQRPGQPVQRGSERPCAVRREPVDLLAAACSGSIFNPIRWVNLRTIKETFVPPADCRPHMG